MRGSPSTETSPFASRPGPAFNVTVYLPGNTSGPVGDPPNPPAPAACCSPATGGSIRRSHADAIDATPARRAQRPDDAAAGVADLDLHVAAAASRR